MSTHNYTSASPNKSAGRNRASVDGLRAMQRRFMRQLSVSAKLWIMTAIFAVPLVGLGIFYVQSLTDTLWFTETEQRGEQLFLPVDQLIRDVTLWKGLAGGDTSLVSKVDADIEIGRASCRERV